jgi:hypothetical protein
MDGLQIQWLLDGAQEMPPTYALFTDLLLRYLKAPPPAEPPGANRAP